ncbi:DNA-cytosine methyltransferase [uncultured Candidatus Thioglobus sp.]|nr:DNA-cytosine methyltransferase [uncultured Candidatus Thioglobus sp.]
MVRYIDLFSGCGGLSLGLQKSGWKGLFAIEKNADAFLTLKHNLIGKRSHFDWPDWLDLKNHDINTVISKYSDKLKSLRGTIDLVAGGPPCQGFSMAGRRNEKDNRNKLIDSYVEFVNLVQPKILFFENVRGEAYSEYVWKKLQKLGYDVHGEIVNFSEYGIPQKRRRFILIATKNGQAQDFFNSIVKNRADFFKSKKITDNTSLSDAISDLTKINGTQDSPDTQSFQAGIYSKPKSNYQKLMRQGRPLTNKVADSHRFARHRVDTVERFQYILDNSTANLTISDELRKKYNLKKHTIVPLCEKSCTPTLTTLPDDYIHYCEPRILTVREYARIQSFPDSYEFKGKYTTGGNRRKFEVPRYTQIGNAIPPLFSEQAGLALKDML